MTALIIIAYTFIALFIMFVLLVKNHEKTHAIIITFLTGAGTIIGAVGASSYRDTRYDGMYSDWNRREHGYGVGDMKMYALLNGLAAGGYLMGVLEIIASVVLLIAAVVKM